MTATSALGPLVKTVTVPVPPERAFGLFTDDMGQWWPLATHSVGAGDAVGVALDGRVGGRLRETCRNGSTHIWGTVTVWEPPHRVAFSWHPGRPEGDATQVALTFIAVDEGTEVVLEHSGWDRRPDGSWARENYATGWDRVLDCFTEAAS